MAYIFRNSIARYYRSSVVFKWLDKDYDCCCLVNYRTYRRVYN